MPGTVLLRMFVLLDWGLGVIEEDTKLLIFSLLGFIGARWAGFYLCSVIGLTQLSSIIQSMS